MIRAKEDKMGRFSVIVELVNNNDLVKAGDGIIRRGQVRRVTFPAVVDTGAALMVIPESVKRRLGLRQKSKIGVRYADGRKSIRPMVGGLYLEYMGRGSVFDAMVESQRDTALLGVIVMEALDLIVDPTNQKLLPRDPKYPIYEIE
jgi:hypothetical protein